MGVGDVGGADVALGVGSGEGDRVVGVEDGRGAAVVGVEAGGEAGGEVVQAVRAAAHARAAAPTHQDMTRRTRPGYVSGARAPSRAGPR